MGTKSMKPITQPQLRKIYAEAREAGFSNDDLHDILYRVNGKESLKDLLTSEAALLIDALVKHNSSNDDRPGMMTDKQKWLLTDYQCKLGWTDAQMRGFIKKYAHVDFMQWLTKEGASKIIEAVKNIYTKQMKVEVSGNVK